MVRRIKDDTHDSKNFVIEVGGWEQTFGGTNSPQGFSFLILLVSSDMCFRDSPYSKCQSWGPILSLLSWFPCAFLFWYNDEF